VVRFRNDIHIIQRNLLITKALGCPNQGIHTQLEITTSAQQETHQFKKKHKLTQPYICINQGTGRTNKFWNVKAWAQVADRLVERYEARIVLTGSNDDIPKNQEIIAAMKHKPIIAAGKLTLAGTAALIKDALLFLSTDTGPLHIAKAVGTPLIGLFGPINPKQWGYNDKVSICFGNYTTCICKDLPDCIRKTDRYLCMQRISVNDVLSKTDILWKRLNQ
ncbi:MAG: glycosyltransferase family 9 protein, partial [Nanoarchaeota archaeon]